MGSHLVPLLLKKGYTVDGVTRDELTTMRMKMADMWGKGIYI